MMKKFWIIWLGLGGTAVALFTVFSQQTNAAPTAATYYVCDCQPNADGDCVAGSDANSGTNPAVPWQTVEKARTQFNSGTAGDEIRFCQGGAFDMSGASRWVNASCAAAQPCLVADYGPPWASGDEARPILLRTVDDHAFDLSNGGSALAEGGYSFRNLDLRCPACTDAGGWGFFLYNDVNDLLIDSVSFDGFAIGIHLAGSNACGGGDVTCNGRNDRITIRNVTIRNSLRQGILGGGDDILIENSSFENNGNGTIFDHNIYVSGGSRITIRGNDLYRSSLDGNGRCNGTSLVGHGVMSDLLIEGNVVREDVGQANDGCWGIAITPAYGTAEAFSNVIIRGNRVENVGNVAIGTASCLNCTIENNVLIQNQGFGMTAVAIPAQVPQAGDTISANLIVRNNSIWTNTGTGIALNEGSGHTIVSNAIQATGSNAIWNCLDATLAASNYDLIDYNVCGFSAGEWANGVGNLAAWQGMGWATNSIADLPGFVSGSDLRPGVATAVLIQAGHPTLSSPTDFNGSPRPAPPSAGAYEWLELAEKLYIPLLVK
ncbi:MAG: right-handed parallel beta-helix repeat-containing protein [Anaerolineaceae bacterium]|nr:right-handed parallel beta-helix repeat-containing protein [Anaerolineaceae bacterium]